MDFKQERKLRDLKKKYTFDSFVYQKDLPQEKLDLLKALISHDFNTQFVSLLNEYEDIVGIDLAELSIISSIIGHGLGQIASQLDPVVNPAKVDQALDKFDENIDKVRNNKKGENPNGLI